MQGDKLASGAPSAVFTGPRLKFDPDDMERDLRVLPAVSFQEKYMMTAREYELMRTSDGNQTLDLVREVREHCEAIERLTQQDRKQDEALKRQCPFRPFYEPGYTGRLTVTRDQPVLAETQSKLALPRHLRQQKELLPTTGSIINSQVFDPSGYRRDDLVGKRIIFGQMSGTAICFAGYPTFIILDVNEVLAVIHEENAEVIEQPLEPLT